MSWLDSILNSSLSTVILALVCIGLILYGKFDIFPKLQELDDIKEELARIRREKDELFLKCNATIMEINAKMDSITRQVNSEPSAEFNAKILLLLEKVTKMDNIISKHPNNLEMSMSDITRTIQDLHRELNDLVKGYETIASTVLQRSGRDDNYPGMEKLR